MKHEINLSIITGSAAASAAPAAQQASPAESGIEGDFRSPGTEKKA